MTQLCQHNDFRVGDSVHRVWSHPVDTPCEQVRPDTDYKTVIMEPTPEPLRIYVAGPYTTGDPVVNTAEAIRVGNELLKRGMAPFIPHLTMFWHLQYPHPYEAWIKYDLVWVSVCDALLRLPGPSKGADGEVTFAIERGIPVHLSLDTLYAWADTQRSR